MSTDTAGSVVRAHDFAVEELRQIALVVNLREAVEDREAVNLLVIFASILRRPDSGRCSCRRGGNRVLEQPRLIELPVVDEGAVGALLVVNVIPFRRVSIFTCRRENGVVVSLMSQSSPRRARAASRDG